MGDEWSAYMHIPVEDWLFKQMRGVAKLEVPLIILYDYIRTCARTIWSAFACTYCLQSRSLLLYSLSYWSISLPHQDSNLEQRRQKPLCCQLHYEAIIAGMENFEISTWWLTVICSASELHPKMFSDPGGTRTHDPLIKSQVHLPTELRSQSCSVNGTRTRNLRLERATSWPVTL